MKNQSSPNTATEACLSDGKRQGSRDRPPCGVTDEGRKGAGAVR